ncbi:MAG: hypothetical protein IT215_00065 [Chitinophagaceae bacterium]|nr:hypothetical protein [Chitinophagaceae bacterium]
MITIQVYNPFKGSDEDRTIDITEVIEQEKFGLNRILIQIGKVEYQQEFLF